MIGINFYLSGGVGVGERLGVGGCGLTLSLSRVINFKFLLQPHQKYYTTQCEELGFSSLTQMKDDYTTNSHFLNYTFLFKRLGECTF